MYNFKARLVALMAFSIYSAACSDALPPSGYVLGPEDQLTIRILNLDEVTATPYSIDLSGNLDLPRIGRIKAAGLSIDQLQAELIAHSRQFLVNPAVHVEVSSFRSQPVFVLGAVRSPGV